MTWNKTRADRQRDNVVYGHRYRKARQECLERAAWQCQIRLEGCTVRATQADHEGGAANDPEHRTLRAACESCHRKVTAQQGGGYRSNASQRDPQPKRSTAWQRKPSS
jgi:5-methylcytosine-specific restriction endonuclease McrA